MMEILGKDDAAGEGSNYGEGDENVHFSHLSFDWIGLTIERDENSHLDELLEELRAEFPTK